MRNQKGITLISLVISIIILVILVSITISLNTGESSIIKRSGDASAKMEQKAIYENILGLTLYNEDGTLKVKLVFNNVKERFGLDKIKLIEPTDETAISNKVTFQVIGKTGTYTYKIDEKKVEISKEEIVTPARDINVAFYTEGDGVPVPVGFDVLEGTKDTGLVIKNKTEGSEFVWVPISSPLNEEGYLENYVEGYENQAYREPDIITGSDGISYDGDPNNLINAGCTDIDEDGILEADDFKKQLKTEFKQMVRSVNHFGGFYISRYEVSKNGTKGQSKGSTAEMPIYSAINSMGGTNGVTDWYRLYALCKSYDANSVKSSMLWGIQYRTMLSWLGTDATDFDTSNRNTDSSRRTGFSSTDIIRRIYDLGGNSLEWTLESYLKNCKIAYSGFVSGGLSLDTRSYRSPSNSPNGHCSSRMVLHIKMNDE